MIIEISKIDDSRIEEFKGLKDNILNSRALIVAESEKVVLKLLKSDKKIIKLFISSSFYEENKELISKKNCEVYSGTKEVMESIVGFNLHHGVMALLERPEHASLEELDDRILILNGLTSPENVGTMVRNAAAFNVNSILHDSKTCSPFLRRCVRVSMGNIFNVKIHVAENLVHTIRKLQEKGYKIFSTANEEGAFDLPDYEFPKKAAIIIGSEGHGIDKVIKEVSDAIIRIPINDHVAHLNAACSSSIFLYCLTK